MHYIRFQTGFGWLNPDLFVNYLVNRGFQIPCIRLTRLIKSYHMKGLDNRQNKMQILKKGFRARRSKITQDKYRLKRQKWEQRRKK